MRTEDIEAALRKMPCIVCLGNNKVGALKCICEGVLEPKGTMLAAWNGAKAAMIKAHIEEARRNSPDGMTSWDRVEKFRLEHGHLPGDLKAEASCSKCNG